MSKQIPLLAGAALLFASAAQAGVPDAQVDQAPSTISWTEAPAPAAGDAKGETVRSPSAMKVEQDRPDVARPVYLDNGYFGGSYD